MIAMNEDDISILKNELFLTIKTCKIFPPPLLPLSFPPSPLPPPPSLFLQNPLSPYNQKPNPGSFRKEGIGGSGINVMGFFEKRRRPRRGVE